ncbi:sensor domain-containing phosphodiesterase [Thermaerobacillus caldiproteolyticus]|uniref:sensor domain-containing phosphodiesterase n=1 Tax=Thermaerobacillus caldiproteolyticus TaxID=247480 RepID=UPI0018F1F6D1|nr:EAL domain-containing protein [Anoxybacillus caldiproteolyticus]
MHMNQSGTSYMPFYFLMPAMQLIVDEDGYILDTNEFAAHVLGYTREELIGMPVFAIAHEDDHRLVKQQLQFIIHHEKNIVHSLELRKVKKNGEVLFVQEHIRRIQTEQGMNILLISCHNISSEKRAKQLLTGQKKILELIAKETPVSDVLMELVHTMEDILPNIVCSILLVDEEHQRLYHGAASRLPNDFIEAINGLEIAPNAGSCGTAAYRQEMVIVTDIQHDPLWKPFKQFVLPHGLRACWSVPIFSSKKKVLGTFAMYHYEPCAPQEDDIDIIYTFSSLAGLAIEHGQMKVQLQESRQRYKSLFEYNQDAVFSLRMNGTFFSANKAASIISGYSHEELLSMSMHDLVISDDVSKTVKAFIQTAKGKSQHADVRIRHKSGKILYLSVTFVPIFVNQKIVGVSGIAKDITERVEQNERIRQMAYYDSLTGLPNLHLFRELASQSLEEAKQSGKIGAIFYIDLDGFKYINDSLGHSIGDVILQKVAERLQQTAKTKGVAARMSGDEFIIMLPNIGHQQEAIAIAEQILQLLKEPIHVDELELCLTGSIGIAFYPRDGMEVETLMRYADMAMYEVKRKGKNSYYIYDEEKGANLFLLNDLHNAIKKEELTVYYQPIIDVQTKDIVAMETLIRWQHPIYGIVPPNQFIPLAEETGLIVPIGEWIVKKACRQHEQWRKNGLKPIRIAVNVSVKELQDRHFAKRIEAILTETNTLPEWLELEITESIMVYNEATISDNLRRMKELGVRISIDDFGTGYSSLAYLKRLDVDTVKIDQSFISDCPHSYYGSVITNTIISLAHHLHMNVIAEGVEQFEQLLYLQEKGCQEAQGYFLSPPLSSDEATRLLQKGMCHLQ